MAAHPEQPLGERLLPVAAELGPRGFEGAAERVREAVRSATLDFQEPASEDHAFEVERLLLEERRRFLAEAHKVEDRPRLAVALSGGGQRAASFACGVFWTLAERELLPYVSHFSAVSGGGYAASALTSYLMASEPPEPGEGLHEWYRRVVADCILSFQDNISHLVRQKRRAACDLPIVLLSIIGSIVLSMVMVALYVAVPLALFLQQDVGAFLRKIVCYPPEAVGGRTNLGFAAAWVLLGFPPELLRPLAMRAVLLVVVLASAMVFGILRRTLGLCRPPRKAPGKVRWSSSLAYLVGRSARVMALRCFVIGSFYIIVIAMILASQYYHFGIASSPAEGGQQARRLCYDYIVEAMHSGEYRCSDIDRWSGDGLWYSAAGASGGSPAAAFARTYLNETWARAAGLSGPSEQPAPGLKHAPRVGLFVWFNVLLLFCALASAVFRSRLLHEVTCAVGPLWAAFLVAGVGEWAVFGPMTRQPLILGGGSPSGFFPYSSDNCIWFFTVSIVLVMATLPFYGQLQQGIHNFYVMRLRQAYYHPATSLSLLEKVATNPYCPHLLLGASLQDYSRPTDVEPYADFGLSPLFLGGRRTGFLPTAATRCRLAMAMGVSGGAVDMAMAVLSHKARWWIGLLGLQMGAWVRVRRWHSGVFPCLERCRGSLMRLAKRMKCVREDPRAQELLEELMLRSPGILLQWLWCIVFLAVAVLDTKQPVQERRCFHPGLYDAFVGPFLLLVLAVHLSFLPCLAPVLRSPFLRHVLMIFNYNHRSWEVPEQLYLLDGGLADSIGVLALLRRRERWIVATDAASPTSDHCRFIRECIEGALQEKLCSFSDPSSPGRDVKYLLEDFVQDRRRPYLHLKVLYEPWHPGDEPADLFLISMRIPSGDDTPLQGPLRVPGDGRTPLRRELFEPPDNQPKKSSSRSDLHGVCCCDGCHEGVPKFCQRCCGSFPGVTMANQFLTSRLFSELCHLGHELSSQALERMLQEMQQPHVERGAWLRAGGQRQAVCPPRAAHADKSACTGQ